MIEDWMQEYINVRSHELDDLYDSLLGKTLGGVLRKRGVAAGMKKPDGTLSAPAG